MKLSSLQIKPIALTIVTVACCWSVQAFAACPEPTNGTVAICQPSANATVYQVPHIEVNTSPISGSITTMDVYLDNKLIFQNQGPSLNLFPGGIENGTHHLVINTWDNFGRLYTTQENFSVNGNLPSSCPPTSVGVRICSPVQNDVVGQNLGFSVGFKGNAPISFVRAYIDNVDSFDFAPAPGQTQIIADGLSTTVGSHTFTVVAWDTKGVTYKSSVPLKTYYVGDCPPKGNSCTPGIYPTTPNDGDDVESPFRLSASVQNNTASITAMKVYVDGVQSGSSSGPVFDQPIAARPGTHVVIAQAWDSEGKLYRLTENVNVQ